MTDQTEDVSIDLNEIMAEVNSEQNNEVEVKEETKKSKYEDEARAQGWKSPEELLAEGVDPEEIVSAKEYVRYGKLKETTNERIARIEKESEESKRALNAFYERKRQEDQAQLEALKAAQREAVQYAETDKFDQYQKQIDHIQKNQMPQTDIRDPSIVAWEAKNQWVFNGDEKAKEANRLFKGYASENPNASVDEALKYVDDRINRLYPNTNPLRNSPTQSETGTRITNKATGKLSWSDQSQAELADYERFGYMYKKPDGTPDKQRWLKVIADDRKAKGVR